MRSKYSLRIEVEIDTNNKDEAEKLMNDYLKELPRSDSMRVKKTSLYSVANRALVSEDVR